MKQNKSNPTLKNVLKKSALNFATLLPMIIGIVILVAIVQTFVTPKMIASIFGDNNILNVFKGTISGAIATGNGAISYVIAEGLKQQGVLDYALIAFILAWTTLSITNIAAEVEVFGIKFTTYRNILTFLTTLLIAYLTPLSAGVL